MHFIFNLFLIAAVVIVVLAVMKPDTFRVERNALIKAPTDKIFPLVNDFHEWGRWSPWEPLDPGMKRTHSGAANGKGAIYEWDGNKKVGAGRMEILESTPSSALKIKLDFIRPFEGHNITDFTFTPEGDNSTRVNWAMHGPAPFMSKLMQVFMSMDKMIGKDFTAGLSNLAREAEK